jgi:MFS family permease
MTIPTSDIAPARRGWAAFATRDYWHLWTVGLVLFVVRWIEMLAMGVFVYQRTGSPLIVALLTMLRLLPMAFFGAFIGAMADRFERRTTLFFIVLTLFVTEAVLAVLAHLGMLSVWHLAVATAVNGTTWAADNPVRRILLGEVVGADQVGRAMAMDTGANTASRFVGPTIGGFLLAGVGIGSIFALGMACYAVALFSAASIRHRTGTRSAEAGTLLRRIGESIVIAWREPRLVGTMIVTIIFNLFGWPFTSMIPVIGQDSLHLSPRGIGLLASADGFGAFCGAIAIAVLVRQRLYARLYVWGTATYLVAIAVFALAPVPLLAGVALLATGFTGAAFMTMQTTLTYLLAPPEIRSRVFGVLAVCIGVGPVGFIYLGMMADWMGAPAATAFLGAQGLAIMALSYPYWRAVLRV